MFFTLWMIAIVVGFIGGSIWGAIIEDFEMVGIGAFAGAASPVLIPVVVLVAIGVAPYELTRMIVHRNKKTPTLPTEDIDSALDKCLAESKKLLND